MQHILLSILSKSYWGDTICPVAVAKQWKAQRKFYSNSYHGRLRRLLCHLEKRFGELDLFWFDVLLDQSSALS